MKNFDTIELPEPFKGSNDLHTRTRNLILRWFAESKRNAHYSILNGIDEQIEYLIGRATDELKGAVKAWHTWSEWENRNHRSIPDPGLHIAMNLAAYCEWIAQTESGIIDEPFKGIPQIRISISS